MNSGALPPVVRRALRITLAASTAFLCCLHLLHQPVTATYALFASVALGGLSRIPGSGRQRATVIAAALPPAWLLLTIGTLLAVRTWAAVVGMAVIGFVLAFAAVLGPRVAGVVPGLQLLYILPCFPPYAPDTLGERLGGATLGIGLLVLLERFLLPDPRHPGYPELLADATEAAAHCADELAHPPWTLTAGARERARRTGAALRPSRTPEADRPAGPGARDRALAHGGAAARELLARLQDLSALRHPSARPDPSAQRDPSSAQVPAAWAEPPAPASHPGAAARTLLDQLRRSTTDAAAVLRAGTAGPDPAAPESASPDRASPNPASLDPASLDPAALDSALQGFRDERAARCVSEPHSTTVEIMRRQAKLVDAAEAARTTLRAVDIALGRPLPPTTGADDTFWYAQLSLPALCRYRLAGHFSRRSVYFQNAVRISVGLAAARTVAGLVSLPHGFWAMLAALTLTRTTTVQTRTTVRQALTGTLLGALAAAGLLVLVGGNSAVYAFALPVLMLATFCLGPTLGVGWAQGLFTLLVSAVFAQLAPAGWQLAEARVLDVLTGSAIGLLCGLFAWPHGGLDELRRGTGTLLRGIAATVTATVAELTGPAPAVDRGGTEAPGLRHALVLMESSYRQAQLEPPAHWADPLDWQAALITGHHAERGAARLLDRYGPSAPSAPWPTTDSGTRALADRVAEHCLHLADHLEHPDDGNSAPARNPDRGHSQPELLATGVDDIPPALVPLLFDTEAWLLGLSADLERISTDPADRPTGRTSPGPG
jgi:hypothetical protein